VQEGFDTSERKKVHTMRASTKNLILGRFHRMRGSVRVTVGSNLKWRRVAFSGHMERLGGMARMNFGRMERVLGW
jgi:hypothetical protein